MEETTLILSKPEADEISEALYSRLFELKDQRRALAKLRNIPARIDRKIEVVRSLLRQLGWPEE